MTNSEKAKWIEKLVKSFLERGRGEMDSTERDLAAANARVSCYDDQGYDEIGPFGQRSGFQRDVDRLKEKFEKDKTEYFARQEVYDYCLETFLNKIPDKEIIDTAGKLSQATKS